MKQATERAEGYLELFRDEQYLELSAALKKETPHCVVEFCRMVVKYEGPHHLEFIRDLLSGDGSD